MHPLFVLLGLKAHGRSRIIDYRYPDRVGYLEQLGKFCPDSIQWKPGNIVTHGPAVLHGKEVAATDLRGGVALILGGLLADGVTRVGNVGQPLRGYNRLPQKLGQLGIRVETR
jgi:UDP-N-acetylglucosamine 1-carboxyvinyltransferase